MARISRRVRRLSGTILLAAAVLMVLLGSTLLQRHLDGISFAFYWLACFTLVILALIVALWDIASLRQEVRDEQIRLMKDVFDNSPDPAEDHRKPDR